MIAPYCNVDSPTEASRPVLNARPAAADAEAESPAIVRGATAIIPQELISDGEVVILAIKPSLWFILLVSMRWLAVAAVACVAAELLDGQVLSHVFALRIQQAAILIAAIRLIVGALQWLGRVYVLTDRRVMRLKGVLRIDLFQCQLSRIQHTELSLPLSERILFCGTVVFFTAGTDMPDAAWLTVPRPAQVYQAVIDTIDRYRGSQRGT